MKRILHNHWGLCLVFVCVSAFLIRVSLSGLPGYGGDLTINQRWAKSALHFGLAESYSQQLENNILPNYPPLSMIMFRGLGSIIRWFDPVMTTNTKLSIFLIKHPGMIADILVCIAIYWLGRKRIGEEKTLIAAVLFALNPLVWHNSAVWGQVDSAYALLTLVAIGFALRKKGALSGIFMMAAILYKMQAIIYAPIVFFLLYPNWQAILKSTLGGLLTTLIVLIPFYGTSAISRIWHVYAHSVGNQPSLSNRAYNLWWGLFADGAAAISSVREFFGIMSYRSFGILAFFLLFAWMLWRTFGRTLWQHKKDTTELMLASLWLASGVNHVFFIVNTEMHERYLLPFAIFGILPAMMNKAWAWIYWVTCFLSFGNMVGVLPFSFIDRALYQEFPAFDVMIAWGTVACMVYAIVTMNHRYLTK